MEGLLEFSGKLAGQQLHREEFRDGLERPDRGLVDACSSLLIYIREDGSGALRTRLMSFADLQ
jgi:hypothetical protein